MATWLIRSALEKDLTPAEMAKLIDKAANDRESFPDEVVHLRQGIWKVLLEEYAPLQKLAVLVKAATARLSPKSFQGPDGILVVDAQELTVQITVAGSNHNTALHREMLAERTAVWPNLKATRNKKSGEVETSGVAFRSRESGTSAAIAEIVKAIQQKVENYIDGTDALLVVAESREESTLDKDWQSRLANAVEKLGSLPYQRIYVSTRKRCFRTA
jgi:hypothetical protein